MKIISNNTQFHMDFGGAVAIGKFDGMHLGHRYLIETLQEKAKERGLQSVVFTFDPSPAVFFSGERTPELFTREEKRRVFASLGVDVLVEFPLNDVTSAITAKTFVADTLAHALRAKLIAAGGDLSFGYRGEGDFALLRELSRAYDFETCLIEKLTYEGREISSTYVREAVSAGDMETANALLGAPYSVSGNVKHGRRLGRTIGFPTVNLTPEAGKLLPPNGVYFTKTLVDDALYEGVTNIGVRPTVSESGVKSVETYLFGYDGDLYDREITVRLYHFARSEQTFADVDALKAQLSQDAEAARAYFRNCVFSAEG